MDTLPHEKQIQEYVKTIEHLKQQNSQNSLFNSEIRKLEQKLDKLKEKVYGELTPWQRVMICRHPSRPHSIDYIKQICSKFVELFGDRHFADDPALIGGLATIGDIKCMVIGQEKGHDTESRVRRNFGMLNPEGYRKALRLMKLAEKFNLPVISLIDTPGANPILDAEERGQGLAIAENLREMSQLAVPIIVIVIGEGCSGGALGMGIGDSVAMLQHAYYSIISPEGCASILWKDPSKKQEAAEALKLTSEDLLQYHVIDTIINEPLGGAHHNPQMVYDNVKQHIIEQCRMLRLVPKEVLVEQRYFKFRKMGQFLKSERS